MENLLNELKEKWILDKSSNCWDDDEYVTYTDVKVTEEDFYDHPPTKEYVFIQMTNNELTLSFCKPKSYFVINLIVTN
jgi:hypothetical protein